MATITGLTADRMLEIEGQTVISGEIVGNHLILTKFDGTTVDTGVLPPGPQGPVGPAGGLMPGELRIWPGGSLPPAAEFGKWVWADGGVYVVATYPKAAANIASQWRTFAGASDPGAANFRVPDMRGLTPAGMDQMPGGARANRLTRSISIVLAGKTGEELHVITLPETAPHTHPTVETPHAHTSPPHTHLTNRAESGGGGAFFVNMSGTGYFNSDNVNSSVAVGINPATTGVSVGSAGAGQAHETMQPTVFLPYIVKLDD